jgi:hypothetical protein
MERFAIQAVSDRTIGEAADFLYRWHTDTHSNSSAQGTIRQDGERLKKHLCWLLLENPLAASSPQHGFCVRGSSGMVVGLMLCFPNAFLLEDRRLVGLCSGSFFVEQSARMQGFYLFKKYLNDSSSEFCFGTTCNAISGALWKKVGGLPVPHSEKNYILPLKLEAILPAFVAGKTSSKTAQWIARLLGYLAKPSIQLGLGGGPDFTIEPCDDWQTLSEIFLRHRTRSWITTDRSPEFLKWRYGPGSPNPKAEIYTFRDKRGNQGWFALAQVAGGRSGQIRGVLLLDAVLPHGKIEFKQLLPAILGRPTVRMADALFLPPRLGVNFRDCKALIIARPLPGPGAFAITRKGNPPIDVSKLDLVPADGDSAF